MKTQLAQFMSVLSLLTVVASLVGCASAPVDAVQQVPLAPQPSVSPLTSSNPASQFGVSPLVRPNPPLQCPPTATARPGVKIAPTCPPVGGQPPCAKIPTPLPYEGVCVGALSPAKLASTESPQSLPDLFRKALSGNILVGAANESGQIKLYAVDLNSGWIRQIGTSNPGVEVMRVSGRYVVWNRASVEEVFAYDLQANKETRIASGIYPDVSSNIVVWVDWRHVDQGDSTDIYGYDLTAGTEFSVITRPGTQTQPRISGAWVAYLEMVGETDYRLRAHHIQTGEDFEVGAVPVFIPPSTLVAAEYFAISGNRLAWIPAQDLGAIHVYDLNTRKDRVLPNPVLGFSRPMMLALDGDILVYWDEQWIGYDLSRDVAFSVPVFPSDERRGGNPQLFVSGNRLVWILGSDLFTAPIVRGQ